MDILDEEEYLHKGKDDDEESDEEFDEKLAIIESL